MSLRNLFAGWVILAAAFGLIALVLLGFTARKVETLSVEQSRAHQIAREVSSLLALTHEYILHREERAEQQWRRRYATLMHELGLKGEPGRGAQADLHDALQTLPELFDGLIRASNSGVQDSLTLRRSELLIDRLLTETQAISESAFQWESQATEARAIIERRLITSAISLPALLSLLFASSAWLLARRVLRPIGAIQQATAIAAAGNLAVRCNSQAQDEVGDLARGFDHMANELQLRTQSIQAAEAFLRNITDNLPIRIAYVDRDMRYRFVNKRHCERFARPREEIVGKTFDELHGQAANPELISHVRSALAGEKSTFEFTEDIHGRSACIESSLIPDIAMDGMVKGFFSTGVDITERRRQRAELESALKEKEVLLSEVHHRVKNNLQVISSLLQLQSTGIEGAEARELFAESQNRIRSMALIHEKLYQSHDFAQVDFADYVQSLVRMLQASQGGHEAHPAIQVRTAPMTIDIDRAIPAGLILNELVSNCFKHGFPNGRTGHIDVTLALCNGDQATLTVKDDGIGVAADFDPSATDSLGLRLVQMLTDQIGGTLCFEHKQGFSCELVFAGRQHRRSPSPV